MEKNSVTSHKIDDLQNLVVYAAPEGTGASGDFSLKVNQQPVFIYTARVSAVPVNQVWPGHQRPLEQTEIASFANFDYSGKVRREINSTKPIQDVIVRPKSYQIDFDVHGNTIQFDLDRPCQVVVEVNGWHHALHIFANPLEENRPEPDAPGVHYFGPGIHEIGKFFIQSGETVYIAGGAVVYGSINAVNAHDIQVKGRGILDASKLGRFDADQMIALRNCDNVKLEGIILRDANVYAVTPTNCQNVHMNNLKVIGLWRYNSDGIDICNSQHVLVEDCFVRSFDDSLVVKGLNTPHPEGRDTSIVDVVFRNCVVWNDWGRALEIGAETRVDEIRDIVFENCDVLHYVHRALDIQHCDRAFIHNVRFENIRVEDAITEGARIENPEYDPGNASEVGTLIELVIYKMMYSQDETRGRIKDVIFKDISVAAPETPRSNFYGYDEKHQVEDVTIENLAVNGRKVTSIEEAQFNLNPYVSNVKILPG